MHDEDISSTSIRSCPRIRRYLHSPSPQSMVSMSRLTTPSTRVAAARVDDQLPEERSLENNTLEEVKEMTSRDPDRSKGHANERATREESTMEVNGLDTTVELSAKSFVLECKWSIYSPKGGETLTMTITMRVLASN